MNGERTRMNEIKKPRTAMPTRPPAMPPTTGPTLTLELELGAAVAEGD
jgi:hypothetical protein